jgi:hypothetical protein
MDTLCVCGRPLKHTGACRGARRLYRHTSETDALIREAYGKLRKFGNRRALPALRQKLGWPKHVIAKRGRELGLARAKEKPWSAEEKTGWSEEFVGDLMESARRLNEESMKLSAGGIEGMLLFLAATAVDQWTTLVVNHIGKNLLYVFLS